MSVRLLYVEDDNDLRAMLEVLLRREGYDVTAVAAAEDAIVELQSGRYQVLLTDYNLPNKNANWMLQVARAAGCLQKVHVIVLSAAVDPAGVDGYHLLPKPVDLSVLFATLDAAVADVETSEDGPAPVTSADATVALTLYVTGASRESAKALRNVRQVMRKFDRTRIRLTVCDVTAASVQLSDVLEADRVVVTPTLVRQQPLPKLWVFGDLSEDGLIEDLIASGLEPA